MREVGIWFLLVLVVAAGVVLAGYLRRYERLGQKAFRCKTFAKEFGDECGMARATADGAYRITAKKIGFKKRGDKIILTLGVNAKDGRPVRADISLGRNGSEKFSLTKRADGGISTNQHLEKYELVASAMVPEKLKGTDDFYVRLAEVKEKGFGCENRVTRSLRRYLEKPDWYTEVSFKFNALWCTPMVYQIYY